MVINGVINGDEEINIVWQIAFRNGRDEAGTRYQAWQTTSIQGYDNVNNVKRTVEGVYRCFERGSRVRLFARIDDLSAIRRRVYTYAI